MSYRIENILICAVVSFITLHGFYNLISPNIEYLSSIEVSGYFIQVRKVPSTYYTWMAFYYFFTNIYVALLMYFLFKISISTITSLACLMGIIFSSELALFNITGVFKHNFLCASVQSLNFELFFGVSVILLLILFYFAKR